MITLTAFGYGVAYIAPSVVLYSEIIWASATVAVVYIVN